MTQASQSLAPAAGSNTTAAAPKPAGIASVEVPHVKIRPTRGWARLDLPELWRYRELLYLMAWRDVTVRYKQTILGAAWVVMVPLMTMIVFNVLFSLLFGRGNKPTIPNVPYAVSTYCALVPWQLFANTINQASNSLVTNRNLITKVYFPRLIAPLAPVLSSLVDFMVNIVVLALIIAAYDLFSPQYHFELSWKLLTLPLFTLLTMATAAGMSMWLSAANALYRDVRYIVPFFVQTLMYVSPVLYTTDSIFKRDMPAWVHLIYGLNPIAAVVEGFRWALLPYDEPPSLLLIPSTIMVILLLTGGLYYFRRMERTFADLA